MYAFSSDQTARVAYDQVLSVFILTFDWIGEWHWDCALIVSLSLDYI